MNEHQAATAIRKLHLEPNDIIVVSPSMCDPKQLMNVQCGHSKFSCKGHAIIVSMEGVDGICKINKSELQGIIDGMESPSVSHPGVEKTLDEITKRIL